jgi:hypothetical protein
MKLINFTVPSGRYACVAYDPVNLEAPIQVSFRDPKLDECLTPEQRAILHDKDREAILNRVGQELLKERNLDLTDAAQLKLKCQELVRLLIECRDALPAISMASARLHNVKLDLASRIEEALKPWETTATDPNGI